jgi:hypothetical protein
MTQLAQGQSDIPIRCLVFTQEGTGPRLANGLIPHSGCSSNETPTKKKLQKQMKLGMLGIKVKLILL